MLFEALSTAAGLASAGTGILNYFEQKNQNAYQKQAQNITWQREDNAIQRRAADLEAAGLSKTLAAGSAAQTSTPIKPDTPQMSDIVGSGVNKAAAVLDMIQQKANIAKTEAENRAIQLQMDKTRSETIGQDLSNAFSASANPLKKSGIELDVALNTATNPIKIEQMVLDNKIKGVEKSIKEAEEKIKQIAIPREAVALAKDKVDLIAKNQGLSVTEKDLVSKQIAIELAQHDYDWFRRNRIPSHGVSGPLQTGAITAGGLAGVWEKLRDVNSTTRLRSW